MTDFNEIYELIKFIKKNKKDVEIMHPPIDKLKLPCYTDCPTDRIILIIPDNRKLFSYHSELNINDDFVVDYGDGGGGVIYGVKGDINKLIKEIL